MRYFFHLVWPFCIKNSASICFICRCWQRIVWTFWLKFKTIQNKMIYSWNRELFFALPVRFLFLPFLHLNEEKKTLNSFFLINKLLMNLASSKCIERYTKNIWGQFRVGYHQAWWKCITSLVMIFFLNLQVWQVFHKVHFSEYRGMWCNFH